MHLPETLQSAFFIANWLLLAATFVSTRRLKAKSVNLQTKLDNLSRTAKKHEEQIVSLSQALESWKTNSMKISNLKSLKKTLDISKQARKYQEAVLRGKDQEARKEAEERIAQLRQVIPDDCLDSRVVEESEKMIDFFQEKIELSKGADYNDAYSVDESETISAE